MMSQNKWKSPNPTHFQILVWNQKVMYYIHFCKMLSPISINFFWIQFFGTILYYSVHKGSRTNHEIGTHGESNERLISSYQLYFEIYEISSKYRVYRPKLWKTNFLTSLFSSLCVKQYEGGSDFACFSKTYRFAHAPLLLLAYKLCILACIPHVHVCFKAART